MLDADPTDQPGTPADGSSAGAPDAAPATEAPKKAPRRRATKAAAAPAPAVDAPGADAAVVAAPDAPAAPAVRAPRKRAAKAVAAPAPAVPDAPAAPAPDTAAEATVLEPAVAAVTAPPAARAPRKRAAKAAAKSAAPAAAPAGPTAVDEGPIVIPDTVVLATAVVDAAVVDAGGDGPAADGPAAAPAPRTRRRATKAASAPASAAPIDPPAVAPGAPAVEAEPTQVTGTQATAAHPETPARAPRRRRSASSAQATIASPAGPPEAPDAAAEAPAAEPAVPGTVERPSAFAVTFLAPGESAPEAPTRTRRRATRPSGAMAEIAAAVEEAVELVLDAEPPADGADEDAIESLLSIEDADAELAAPTDSEAEQDDQTESPDDSDEAQSAGSRRRRRGRRGRGGRSGRDGAAGSDGFDDALDDDAAPDAGSAPRAAEDQAGEAPDESDEDSDDDSADETGEGSDEQGSSSTRRRRKRRRRGTGSGGAAAGEDDPAETVVHVREPAASRDGSARDGSRDGGRESGGREPRTRDSGDDEVRGIRGSTRLEAKRQRRRDTRDTGRRRAPILTEAEFLARREAVDRVMALRQRGDRTQIAVLEDGILVEHYVTRASATSYVGNIYLGRVQNVLPSMEAAFVDIGKGRNGVLYAGEVNWDAAGLEGRNRTIQDAMSAGDPVLVQVTKDPIGHKGARLTSQISLPGRFLVYVPSGGMTGISRKLPDTERTRLKAILKKIIPDDAGVIIRTAAEGASEEELTQDVERLKSLWESIQVTVGKPKNAPIQVHAEPDLAIRVVRDVFNEDFQQLIVSGDATREDDAWETVSQYVGNVAPELSPRLSKYTGTGDLFHDLRVDEQLAKALDRKVWLPSGGSLVIDRTEAMTVIDVNTGKFTGAGGNLEQTVTRNNIEAAEEIVRQLRLRDIGGMIVVDFIDMVLESNRDLVLRRLTECLGRDRTKHQVAEVTSLGLVQMTRKRVGEGLLEAFSEPCEHCHGLGVIVHTEPVAQPGDTFGSGQNAFGSNGPAAGGGDSGNGGDGGRSGKRRNRRGRGGDDSAPEPIPVLPPEGQRKAAASVMALIAGAVPLADADDVLDALDAIDDFDDIEIDQADAIDVVDSSADEFVEAPPAESEAQELEVQAVLEPAASPAPELDAVHESDPVPELTVQAVFEAAAEEPGDSGPAPVYEGDPTVAPVSRPRRRRGASRPAGPPVHA